MNSILSLSHLQAKDDNVEVWVKRDVPSANELKKMSDLTGVRVRFMCPVPTSWRRCQISQVWEYDYCAQCQWAEEDVRSHRCESTIYVPSANKLKKMSDLTGLRVRFMCPVPTSWRRCQISQVWEYDLCAQCQRAEEDVRSHRCENTIYVPSANELKKMSDLTGVRIQFMCPVPTSWRRCQISQVWEYDLCALLMRALVHGATSWRWH